MQPLDDQNLESYLPVYDTVPEKWEDARVFFVEQLKRISNAVNLREIGWFLDEELLSGKQFIPGVETDPGNSTPLQSRSVFRKVIDFGSVAPIGIPLGLKGVPHGLVFDGNFTLVQLWGAATAPGAQAFNLGHAAAALVNTVELFMDTTNVYTNSNSDRSGFTRVFIVIEYMQEL